MQSDRVGEGKSESVNSSRSTEMVRSSTSPWTDPRPRRSMPLDSNLGLAPRMMAPAGYSPGELLPAVAPYRDTPRCGIEGVYFYTINQIESTDK